VVVVAVSEGIHTKDGKYICEFSAGSETKDAFGHIQMTGTASYLANHIHEKIGCKTRAVEFSSLQRSASHLASRIDINEAFMVGGAAIKAADEGISGVMVVIDRLSDDPYQSTTGVYDVHRIANGEKLVPREWINKEGDYVTDEFISYLRPLIQGDYAPMMVDGLPRHLTMNTKGYKDLYKVFVD
jgi:6-phosphofructokinase 1